MLAGMDGARVEAFDEIVFVVASVMVVPFAAQAIEKIDAGDQAEELSPSIDDRDRRHRSKIGDQLRDRACHVARFRAACRISVADRLVEMRRDCR